MKSKNIPADIRTKSIKDAQNEIKDTIQRLEKSTTNLEESMHHYNRMLLLNRHIQELFKLKAKEIKNNKFKKKKRNFVKKNKK